MQRSTQQHWSLPQPGDQAETVDAPAQAADCPGGSLCKPFYHPGIEMEPTDQTGCESAGSDVECRLHSDYTPVKAPVVDSANMLSVSVHKVSSALVRMRPAPLGTECWDLLLIISAVVQLLEAAWHLVFLSTVGILDVAFGGEILTFLWWCCRASVALLAVQKKLHARWVAEVQRREDVKPEDSNKDKVCGCLCRIRRTPSSVHLMLRTPAVRTSGGPSRPLPQLPFLYLHRSDLRAGDGVRASTRFGAHGSVGTLLSAMPGEGGRYPVDLGGARESLAREDFELADEEQRRRRGGVWQDRLTPHVLHALWGAWALTICFGLLAGPRALADDAGFLILRLQAPAGREPLASWVVGTSALVQIACVACEAAIRTVQFVFLRCAYYVYYA